MLLPLSTDHHDGRIGIVSIGIIILCIVVHLFIHADNEKYYNDLANLFNNYTVEALSDDEYDSYEDGLQAIGDQLIATEEQSGGDATYLEYMAGLGSMDSPESDSVFMAKVDSIRHSTLSYKGSLIKGKVNLFNLFSHMFIHGDWMHLIGNLWFFYIVGIMMERYWGCLKFLSMYLVTGIIAGLGFIFISGLQGNNIEDVSLVGASGAISGMMGALWATGRHIRVTMFYWIRFRVGTFEMSMGWFLGLYFLMDLVYGLVFAKYSATAYMAHVAGFVGGVILGYLIKGEKFENLHQDPIDRMVENVENKKLAMDALPDVAPAAAGAVAGKARSLADLPDVAGGDVAPATVASSYGGGAVAAPQGSGAFVNTAAAAAVGTAAATGAAITRDPQTPCKTSDAWAALQNGNGAAASEQLVEAMEFYLLDTIRYQKKLEEEMVKIYRSAKQLPITADIYTHWGMAFVMGNMKKCAVLAYELAAQFTTDSAEKQMKLMLKSAELRVELNMDLERAKKFFTFVIQKDQKGPLKREAEYYLEQIQ